MTLHKSFTNLQLGGIIFPVKKNRFLKFALAATLAAAIIPASATVAFAEESPKETIYPSEFTHDLYDILTDNITDYAVDGDDVAFAVGTELAALYTDDDGERKLAKYTHESPITALDYSDGKLYMNTAVNVYAFSPKAEEKHVEEHEFSSTSFPITVDENSYYSYINSEKELIYWNDNEMVSVGKNFINVKSCDDGIFALKDNRLYKITGASSTEVTLEYTDFDDADNIYSGNTAQSLKNADYQVKIGKVATDAYVTKIKDTEIGEKFEKATDIGATKKSAGVPCLILAESGNASIIATNDGMYITATANITEAAYSARTDASVGKTFYSLEDIGVYSRPYVSGATRIDTLKSGSSYTVKATESFHLDYINTDFLRVTYTNADGDEVSGFVVKNFLTEYSFTGEENEHEKQPYENYDDKTNVVTVVVVIIIVALIIIAILYLAAKLGKSKNKDKKKQNKKKSENDKKKKRSDDDEDDDEDEEDESQDDDEEE